MITLMYHDVVEPEHEDASGFAGPAPASYKVSPAQFAEHLAAIVNRLSGSHARIAPPIISFDDGGISAMRAADTLEQFGLRGHFFVTADYIGTPGFVHRRDMRELSERDHVIGSHSCSHPIRMGHCRREQLDDEWTRSREIISDAIGKAITTASVPGGDFSPAVADAALMAGYTELFTSEPTPRDHRVSELLVHGRFTIRRWTSATTAAALAAGDVMPAAMQSLTWNVRKLGKRVAGDRYLQVRRLLLGQSARLREGEVRQ